MPSRQQDTASRERNPSLGDQESVMREQENTPRKRGSKQRDPELIPPVELAAERKSGRPRRVNLEAETVTEEKSGPASTRKTKRSKKILAEEGKRQRKVKASAAGKSEKKTAKKPVPKSDVKQETASKGRVLKKKTKKKK